LNSIHLWEVASVGNEQSNIWLRNLSLLTDDRLRCQGDFEHCNRAFRAPNDWRGWSTGANAMRSVFAFGLLAALCTPANAATVHHVKRVHYPRHVTGWPGQAVDPSYQRSDPRFPPVIEDQTPSYNDPSKFGGG
jgi:hypothetical protein